MSLNLLKDILYEEEKERIANRYRLAIVRIGEVASKMKPKQKGVLLDAMRQAGFDKEDLREKGWTFSNHLWNSCAIIGSVPESLPQLVPSSGLNKKRPKSGTPLMGFSRVTSLQLLDIVLQRSQLQKRKSPS